MAGQQSSSVIVILCLILAALMGSARGQDMTYPAAAAPGLSSDMAPAAAPDAPAPASDASAPAPAPDAAAAPAPDTNAADAAQAPAPQAEAAAAPAPGPGVDITTTAATAYRSGPPPSEPPCICQTVDVPSLWCWLALMLGHHVSVADARVMQAGLMYSSRMSYALLPTCPGLDGWIYSTLFPVARQLPVVLLPVCH